MGRFVSIAEARAADGLRLVCMRQIPNPWQEAAKGVLYVKGLDCQYAAQSDADVENAIADWTGDSSAPVVAYRKEKLRSGWAEILMLAERLAPEPALIPEDPRQRALMFGLSHEILGEMGLGWCRRLLLLRAGMDHSDDKSISPEAAASLAGKYGFNPGHVAQAEDRVVAVLGLLDEQLGTQAYFLDGKLSAVDIYWATMANLLTPLDADRLPMAGFMRGIYATENERFLAALTPALRAHQERVYEKHLELPVPL
jgi:glutathione S-transferase